MGKHLRAFESFLFRHQQFILHIYTSILFSLEQTSMAIIFDIEIFNSINFNLKLQLQ